MLGMFVLLVMFRCRSSFSPSNARPTSRSVTNAAFYFLSITLNPSWNGTTVASHRECDSCGEPPARWRAQREDWGIKAVTWDERPRVTDTWDYVDGRERRKHRPRRGQGDAENEHVQLYS